jgi:hypothetical protein
VQRLDRDRQADELGDQFLLDLFVEGADRDPLAGVGRDPPPDRLDDRGRLAAAGAGDDDQVPEGLDDELKMAFCWADQVRALT